MKGRRAEPARYGGRVLGALTSIALVAAAASGGLVGRASGQAPPATVPATAATPAPSPTVAPPSPIPAAEVFPVGEELESFLRGVDRLAEPDPAIDGIAARVPEYSARIEARLDSTAEMIDDGAQLQTLDKLASAWYTVQAQLGRAAGSVAKRAADIERSLEDVEHRREIWTATRAAARADDVPPAIRQRIDTALADLGKARQQLEAVRATTLDLQSRLVAKLVDVDGALARIGDARLARVGSLFRRDNRAIWQLDVRPNVRAEAITRIRDFVAFEFNETREFLVTHQTELLVELLILIALGAIFRTAGTQIRAWVDAEPDLERKALVFQRPYSSAYVLWIMVMRVVFLQMPHLLWRGTSLLAVVPIMRLMRIAGPPDARPAMWVIVAFFVLDQVRDLVSSLPQLEQVVFLVEALMTLAFVAWLRRGRSPKAQRLIAALHMVRPVAVVNVTFLVLVVSTLAAATGFMQLARLLGGTLLAGAYVAISLFVAVRAADGLIALALRVGPLARLRMVQRHHDRIERRAHRWTVRFAAVFWCIGVLRSLAIDQVLWNALRAMFAAPLAPSVWSVTLGDIGLTVAVVWAAFTLSRLIRFVLDEEIYPRVDLARGIPYAVSTLLHYVLLLSGFTIALGAIGLDLNRFTILAGAFGVGIGFGLQNVVNNFVSGLILLFERPVQVGDSVQIGELIGDVRRIGIRSSTVRTWQGAEVIVPNGNLISEEVTNWTLSDRTRRIDIALGVAYDSDPERVLEILRTVGRSHPAVMNDPAPLALFIRFGDNSLDFELRVWTNRFEQYAITRSDLGIAVLRALGEARIRIPFPNRELHVQSIDAGALAALAAHVPSSDGKAKPSGGSQSREANAPNDGGETRPDATDTRRDDET